MIIWSAIDPGTCNFFIGIFNNKTVFKVDFGSVKNYFKYLKPFLDFFFSLINVNFKDSPEIRIVIEEQIKKKFNKNIKLEVYLRKCLSLIENVKLKVLSCPAHFKNKIGLKEYQFAYKKIRSKKSFISFIKPNLKLYNTLLEYTIYTFIYSDKNRIQNSELSDEHFNVNKEIKLNFIIQKLEDILELKKFDDIVDIILMLAARFMFNT